ncbi:MAG TPA: hypothetical protein VIH57_25430 [Bacteroidales bacterium]
MKTSYTIKKTCFTLFTCMMLAGSTLSIRAQLSRIAIVNHVDSTLIHIHQGLTIFGNEMDTFDCKFNSKKYIDLELPRLLSVNATVNLVDMPDSVLAPNGNLYSKMGNIKKTFKSWISSLNDRYDFVIYIWNDGSQIFQNGPIKIKLGGIMSGPKVYKKGAVAFSAVTFIAFRSSNLKELDYNAFMMPLSDVIKQFKIADSNMRIDPEMFPVIKASLSSVLDKKMEYFLTRTYLVPQTLYDSVKKH